MDQEKFNKSENKKETTESPPVEKVVSIEARSAKKILDEAYFGASDYDQDDYGDDYFASSMHEYGIEYGIEYGDEEEKALSYVPFDAGTSLRQLKSFSPQEKLLSIEERRMVSRERLTELKQNLEKQDQGIALLINSLYAEVTKNPGVTKEELLLKVKDAAPQCRLSDSQLYFFECAIEDYCRKHTMVETYRAMHPRDEDLFEACFGKKSTGKIQVIKGPMTLHFQCFSRDDFVTARYYYKLNQHIHEVSEEDKQHADLAGGFALSTVRIPELKDTVTIENARYHLKYEVIREEKIAEIHNTEIELGIDQQKSDIDIDVKGYGQWKIKFVERDNLQFPIRMQLLDVNSPGELFKCDVVRVEPKIGQYIFVLQKAGDDEHSYFNVREDLRIKQGENWVYVGDVEINYSFITIRDISPEGTLVTYQEDVALPPYLEEEYSNKLQSHEQQHQFNKLFVPLEIRTSIENLRIDVAEHAKTSEQAKEMIVRHLTRWHRADLVDQRARDEIIAYYHEGRNFDDIFKALSQNSLYDYFEQQKEYYLNDVAREIVDEVEEGMSEVTYIVDQEERFIANDYFVTGAVSLKIDKKMVQHDIELVFKDEYKRDLHSWIDTLRQLEQKGYCKEEIVSLLVQKPVRNWRALARRLSKKEKED